jgi:hypothetical protein
MAAKSHAERAAENESIFRDANEQLREVFEGAEKPAEARLPFLCECANTRCTQVLLLSLQEYAEVRQYPARFLTAPDHEEPDTEVVVREERRYQVVEKRGEAATIAARLSSLGRTA